MIRHLDLFSGIGCWALAGREAFGARHEMVGFCEIDPFCRAVLTRHFPNVPIYGDIKTLADAKGKGRRVGPTEDKRKAARKEHSFSNPDSLHAHAIDILTASPPCQAASSAGRRKGTKDDRWLWPATLAVIARTRPRWVVLENVRGLLSLKGGLVFDDLLAGVEKNGYEVWPFVAPAAGVGAPHQRARVWIVAHRIDSGGKEHRPRLSKGQGRPGLSEPGQAGSNDPDAESTERAITRPARSGRARLADRRRWHTPWQEVALRTCNDRMDDGAPARVYGPEGISEAAHRRERLKACGNAIVPQVAVEIMKAIDAAGI